MIETLLIALIIAVVIVLLSREYPRWRR